MISEWIIAYLILVGVHIALIGILKENDSREADKAMIGCQLLCLIPIVWLIFWLIMPLMYWEVYFNHKKNPNIEYHIA